MTGLQEGHHCYHGYLWFPVGYHVKTEGKMLYCFLTPSSSSFMYLSPNTKQFCDVLATRCGYRVVLPDWFRGKPATPDMLGDMSKLKDWLQQVGTIEIVSGKEKCKLPGQLLKATRVY